MNTFLELQNYERAESLVSFEEIKHGEFFWCSGSLYIKTEGIATEIMHGSSYSNRRYNAFNLRTLKVGEYSKNTKVYRVTAEPLKYKVHKNNAED